MSTQKLEVWSFFSGAMGLDIGLELAGLPATLALEKDSTCCETIRHNRPELLLIEDDVQNVTGAVLREKRQFDGEVFLMAGGPPCQSFSPGGKRAALSDPRGNLIYEYLRLIGEVQPRFFLFENVANLTTAALRHREIKDRPGKNWNLRAYSNRQVECDDGQKPMEMDEMSGSAIRQILTEIRKLNYHIKFGVVDAADYGAPQHRLRFVMVGAKRGEPPDLPERTHGHEHSGLNPFRTVRDAIFDLRESPGPHSNYTPAVARFFRLVPPGGCWRNLPQKLQREALGPSYHAGGGKTGFFRKLHYDSPSPTITTKPNRKGSAMCHPEFVRPISVRECARLQGFPDDWVLTGAMNQQYQQIGNAVPVALGTAVGKAILKMSVSRAAKACRQSMTEFELMLDAASKRLRRAARNKRNGNTTPDLFHAITNQVSVAGQSNSKNCAQP